MIMVTIHIVILVKMFLVTINYRRWNELMEKIELTQPVLHKAKAKNEVIICKTANCSGGSSHSLLIHKTARPIEMKKAA